MAYRKRYKKTRRTKKLNTGMKNAIKKIVNRKIPFVETKQVLYNDFINGGVPIITSTIDNNAGILYPMIRGRTAALFPQYPALQLSAGPSNRIGTEISLKKLDISWTSFVVTGANGSSYRVIIFADTQTDAGTLLAPTDLFITDEPMFNSTNSAGSSINYQFNIDTVGPNKRYRILHDRIYDNRVMGYGTSAGGATADNNFRSHRVVIRWPGKGTKILLSPQNINGPATVQNKQVYMYLVASNGGLTPNRIAQLSYQLDYQDA